MKSRESKMAVQKWQLIMVMCILMQACKVSPSQEIMHKLTKGFATAFEQCKQELNLGDNIMQDFLNYWREEYELLNRDTGCAIMCMAQKHDLLTEDGIHHEKVHGFTKSHGADDELAKQLVTMIHECEKSNAGVSDECMKTLEVAKCFRTKIHELKWAPDMETILEEIMTDI